MRHEYAAFEVGFGEDVGERSGVVDMETGVSLAEALKKGVYLVLNERIKEMNEEMDGGST